MGVVKTREEGEQKLTMLSRRSPNFVRFDDVALRARVKTGDVAMLKKNIVVRDLKLAIFKFGDVRRSPDRQCVRARSAR
jgi:hypothetical protein